MPLSHTGHLCHTDISQTDDGSLFIYSLPEADVPPWPDELEHNEQTYILDASWLIPLGRAWKYSGAARYIRKENVLKEQL